MELIEVTDRINRLSEELEKLRPLKPEDEIKVMQKFRLDWNYNSNNIEGNSLTYGETKALLLFGITAQGKPLKDHLEIEGHNEAIDSIVKVARNNEPLTEAFIRNLHKMLLHESYEIDAITSDGQPTRKIVEKGKYKTTPNHVKTVTGELFYFTSPEDTPAKMEELMNWYHENLMNKKVHPLIFAVEFHHRFIRIHPFDDGNGRVVRLLMNLLLMQKGFPPVIIKSKEKELYYAALQQADSGNLEPFYIFVGEQLTRSLEIMLSAAKGEDIEEPDDIDKEIALLKRELEERDEIKELRSNETIESILPKIVNTMSKVIFPGLNQIREMYLQTQLLAEIVTTNNSSFSLNYLEESLIDFVEMLKSKVDKFKMLRNINFVYRFKIFKRNSNQPFDTDIKILVSFDQYHYLIKFEGKDYARKLYHQSLTKEENVELLRAIKKYCINYIKENLKIG